MTSSPNFRRYLVMRKWRRNRWARELKTSTLLSPNSILLHQKKWVCTIMLSSSRARFWGMLRSLRFREHIWRRIRTWVKLNCSMSSWRSSQTRQTKNMGAARSCLHRFIPGYFRIGSWLMIKGRPGSRPITSTMIQRFIKSGANSSSWLAWNAKTAGLQPRYPTY